jgi:6-pyruvoyltetrahydropterin/6-carboxytetrahydropterin synthase
MKVTCTRRLEWDAMHRVPGHLGYCRAYHGHRYVAEITCQGAIKDDGMIVDFGVVKGIVGAWIDEHWDHNAVLWRDDPDPAIPFLVETNRACGKEVYFLDRPPTAEILVAELARVAQAMLEDFDITVCKVKIFETPNCSAEWALHETGSA